MNNFQKVFSVKYFAEISQTQATRLQLNELTEQPHLNLVQFARDSASPAKKKLDWMMKESGLDCQEN